MLTGNASQMEYGSFHSQGWNPNFNCYFVEKEYWQCRIPWFWIGLPSSRRQVITGSGWPVALHRSVVFWPSVTMTSPLLSLSTISGGTETKIHFFILGKVLHYHLIIYGVSRLKKGESNFPLATCCAGITNQKREFWNKAPKAPPFLEKRLILLLNIPTINIQIQTIQKLDRNL